MLGIAVQRARGWALQILRQEQWKLKGACCTPLLVL